VAVVDAVVAPTVTAQLAKSRPPPMTSPGLALRLTIICPAVNMRSKLHTVGVAPRVRANGTMNLPVPNLPRRMLLVSTLQILMLLLRLPKAMPLLPQRRRRRRRRRPRPTTSTSPSVPLAKPISDLLPKSAVPTRELVRTRNGPTLSSLTKTVNSPNISPVRLGTRPAIGSARQKTCLISSLDSLSPAAEATEVDVEDVDVVESEADVLIEVETIVDGLPPPPMSTSASSLHLVLREWLGRLTTQQNVLPYFDCTSMTLKLSVVNQMIQKQTMIWMQ